LSQISSQVSFYFCSLFCLIAYCIRAPVPRKNASVNCQKKNKINREKERNKSEKEVRRKKIKIILAKFLTPVLHFKVGARMQFNVIVAYSGNRHPPLSTSW
jgi:adenine-specific DNA methylase